MCLRKALTSSALGTSFVKKSRVSRPAPSGVDIASSGCSSVPIATSNEPPPISATSSRPEDQPNQRRTARKVRIASCSPSRTCKSIPVSVFIFSRTASEFFDSRIAEVANAKSSSQSCSSMNLLHSCKTSINDLTEDFLRSPSSLSCSANRSSYFWDIAGIGAAPA